MEPNNNRENSVSPINLLGVICGLISVAAYLYFRFTGGLEHPAAKILGIYSHRIATLNEYADYKRYPNKFYDRTDAISLSFDCDAIRDDFVKLTRQKLQTKGGGSQRGASRNGMHLHIADSELRNTETGAAFSEWTEHIRDLATTQHAREEGHYGSLLQALFTAVTIHGGPNEEATFKTKRTSKFDFCGPPRE